MVTEVTAGIRVSVETFFQPSHTDATQSHFVFAYRITITNDGDYAVQLKRRHWFIVDAYMQKREVEGEGVVGEQPVIQPGESYQYVSGCDLKTEIGKMFGSYLMEKQMNNEAFQVKIPQFKMVAPYKSN